MPAEQAFSRPSRRRIRAIAERLRATHGEAVLRPHRDPMHELVLTVLSQHTNDRNRDLAYARLRERFPTWEEVAAAPEAEVAAAIRPGGLANVKAARIQEILRRLAGDDLAWVEHAPLEQARRRLCELPGVGRKTAACVLLFAFGRPEFPVDTHVDRVGKRLGLFRPRATFAEEHDEMLRLTEPAEGYELHINLIRHGRSICVARSPRCHVCPLRRMCPYGRGRLAAGASAAAMDP